MQNARLKDQQLPVRCGQYRVRREMSRKPVIESPVRKTEKAEEMTTTSEIEDQRVSRREEDRGGGRWKMKDKT